MKHMRETATQVVPSWPRRLLPHCIVLGLLSATPVLAQDTAAPAAKSTQDTSEQQATELAGVTVTAQGREQDILTVPYNISAVSGQTIEANHILEDRKSTRLNFSH